MRGQCSNFLLFCTMDWLSEWNLSGNKSADFSTVVLVLVTFCNLVNFRWSTKEPVVYWSFYLTRTFLKELFVTTVVITVNKQQCATKSSTIWYWIIMWVKNLQLTCRYTGRENFHKWTGRISHVQVCAFVF